MPPKKLKLKKNAKDSKPAVQKSIEPPRLELIRFKRFKQVVDKALQETLKNLDSDKLESCYPNITKTAIGRKYLKLAQDQIRDYWQAESKKEFELIYEERDLEKKLDSLDRLIYDAEMLKYKGDDEDKLFPDQLTPEDIVRAKLSNVKKQRVVKYEKQLQELKKENEDQVAELRKLMGESNSLIKEIETKVGGHFEGVDNEAKQYDEINRNIKELLRQVK